MTGQEERIANKCETMISKSILNECVVIHYEHMKKYHGKWHKEKKVMFPSYFMLNASYNLWNLVKLWAKVFFYSVFLSGVLVIIGIQKISFNVLLNTIFPILRHEYWFFTIYILLFLLIPFINVAIRKMSKKMHGVLVLIILLFFYIEPLFSAFFYKYDAEEGVSIIAFLTLYIIGAYLSRCNDISIKRCIFLLLGSSFLMLLSKITLELIVNKFALSLGTGLLYHNNSIFVLINAIALFEIFKQIRLSDRVRKIVSWISSSVFSVYLLHEKPAIRSLIWNSKLDSILVNCSFIQYCVIILGICFSIFIIGIIFDKICYFLLFKRFSCNSFSEKIQRVCAHYNNLIKNVECNEV